MIDKREELDALEMQDYKEECSHEESMKDYDFAIEWVKDDVQDAVENLASIQKHLLEYGHAVTITALMEVI